MCVCGQVVAYERLRECVCVTKLCVKKVVCERLCVCVTKLREEAEEEAEEATDGIQNQKQEPHTKMRGTSHKD